MAGWQFLTNHAQALLCIEADPGIRLRDIAASLEITERAAHRIVGELVEDGYVSRERRGRRNQYELQAHRPLRDPMLRDRKLADLLGLLNEPDGNGATRRKKSTGSGKSKSSGERKSSGKRA